MNSNYPHSPHPKSAIGLPGFNREINASQVMDLIYKQGPISRAELVKQTGIKAKTISSIVDQFIHQGLIDEVGLAKSTGGRPPVLYEIRPSGLHVIGIEIRHCEMKAVLVDLSGTLLTSHSKKLKDTSVDTVIVQAKTMVQELCDAAKIACDKLDGIGITLPGFVDSEQKSVVFSASLDWEDVPFGHLLTDTLNVDVRIFNDAVANVINICFQKRRETPQSVLMYYVNFDDRHCVFIDFGFAFALNGRAYLGHRNMVGELTVHLKNPFQQLKESQRSEHFSNYRELAAASLKDQELADELWSPLTKVLANEMVRGSNMLNPAEIVISSNLPEFEAIVGTSIQEIFAQLSMPVMLQRRMKNKQLISMPKLGFQIRKSTDIALGGTLPFIQKFYNPPSIRKEQII